MLPLVRYKRLNRLHSHKNLLLLTAYFSTTAPPPPPIEVLLTESAGRGVFATRRIGAGELIHNAKPIVSHPSLTSINNVCYFCLKKVGKLTERNFQSQDVPFCSEKCSLQAKVSKVTPEEEYDQVLHAMFQNMTDVLIKGVHIFFNATLSFSAQQGFYEVEKGTDWSSFYDHCRSQGLKYPLLVKRLACMVISGVASADILDILQPAVLSSDMMAQLEKEFVLVRSALDNADISGEQMTFLTKQWYTGVLARIRINAFRVELAGGSYEDLLSSAAASVEAEAPAGNAVYMLPSFYNHDCDPNAHIIWIENVDARLKALRDIEAGEELRICYIDASMDYEARQTILSRGFGFQCNCPRCLSRD